MQSRSRTGLTHEKLRKGQRGFTVRRLISTLYNSSLATVRTYQFSPMCLSYESAGIALSPVGCFLEPRSLRHATPIHSIEAPSHPPHGHAQRQDGDGEVDARLDPLEGPEPARGLVGEVVAAVPIVLGAL